MIQDGGDILQGLQGKLGETQSVTVLQLGGELLALARVDVVGGLILALQLGLPLSEEAIELLYVIDQLQPCLHMIEDSFLLVVLVRI